MAAQDKVLIAEVVITLIFFSVLQGALSERPQMFLDQIRQSAEVTNLIIVIFVLHVCLSLKESSSVVS